MALPRWLWLVDERGIEPHVKLMDKSERRDGTFSRSDFAFDQEGNLYVCRAGKELKKYHRSFPKRDGLTKDGTMIYFARKQDCHACALKPQCCPNVPARKIARSVHEAARDKARAIAKTGAYAVSCRERKKVEMLFAHLKRIRNPPGRAAVTRRRASGGRTSSSKVGVCRAGSAACRRSWKECRRAKPADRCR